MGKTKGPQPVKLILGMISRARDLFERAEGEMAGRYGEVDFASEILPFTHTSYYQAEMGPGLERKFVSFRSLISPDEISRIKEETNRLEQQLGERREGEVRRRINLDPGYLSGSKLVLASTKDYGHRIYLGRGIYAEVTLRFKEGSFQPWEWSYPDYRQEDHLRVFNQIRSIYMRQLE